MESVGLLILLVLAVPICLAIWLISRALSATERIERLTIRQTKLELEIVRLTKQLEAAAHKVAGPELAATKPSVTKTETAAPVPLQEITSSKTSAAPVSKTPLPANEKVPAEHLSPAVPVAAPPLISPPKPRSPIARAQPAIFERGLSGKINWEQFVGVKLLMWIGGFAAFLTVVFAVKYSFERNWITPALRVAAGFCTGTGLLIAGVTLHRRKQYIVGAQTFCATGIVILYATTFACRSIYHFDWFGLVPTFLLMVLITTTAFLLAVRLNALVVAVLGICGGFLTPLLLSTGEDNPFGLFGYIALLDIGLMAVALNKRWHFLALMGAAGTILMQLGWVGEFFVREKYFEHNKALIAFAVFAGFSLLFCGAWAWAQRQREVNHWLTASAITVAVVALLFGFYLTGFEPLAQRPGFVFSYVLLVDLCLTSLVWFDKKLVFLYLLSGILVFLLLTVWTVGHLTTPLLNWALVLYFVFALLHAALPFVFQRLNKNHLPLWWGHLFPPMSLLLMLAPILKFHSASLIIWPVVLLLDLLVFGMALFTASILSILAAVALTLVVAGVWIAEAPRHLTVLPEELIVIGGFAVIFFAAGVWAARKFTSKPIESLPGFGDLRTPSWHWLDSSPDVLAPQLPAFSAILPFVLLIMVSMRLPLVDPSPVFGLALLLVVLLLGLTRIFPLSWLPAVALACVLALEHSWHFEHFNRESAIIPLVWYVVFTLAFAVFPFLFLRQFSGQIVPWAAAALSGPLHFYLVHRLVKAAWPNPFMGLLPLAFAIPSIFGLIVLVRSLKSTTSSRISILAFFGAAALFFVTLIFPIQFERQWITVGWALEGAALLWLFHRVPHHGLRLTGVALLITAFVRLALNPAVLHYHARAATPIFNWYLYTYGITGIALFAGVQFLAPPRHMLMGSNVRALLGTLGTVLAFLLLNIEIADYFTPVGATVLTLEFSGNLARDMTYSIAWGAFALALVIWGIGKEVRPARYAGIALLSVTLLKLFFHDLANLEALYRIGALLGLAIVAIAASFLYQRFFATAAKIVPEAEPKPPVPSS